MAVTRSEDVKWNREELIVDDSIEKSEDTHEEHEISNLPENFKCSPFETVIDKDQNQSH